MLEPDCAWQVESGPPLGGHSGLVTAGFVIWGGLQGL